MSKGRATGTIADGVDPAIAGAHAAIDLDRRPIKRHTGLIEPQAIAVRDASGRHQDMADSNRVLRPVMAQQMGVDPGIGLLQPDDAAALVQINAVPDLLGVLRLAFRADERQLPSLNALENVMLPLELGGISGATAASREWLERVGLGHRLKHYPKHLSGGEQQRVALARAFAPNPQLVLADEPTGNLDAATGQQIIDLMFDLNAKQGTTLLLVTHDEAIAARCGRILRIQSGRLAG